MITQERLKELFDYNPATGWFTNRFSRGRACLRSRAGSPSGHGYRKIMIDYRRYYEHHLAWLFVFDEWIEELDHKDGNGEHNWIDNLRPATRSQNCNNADRTTGISGLRGAYWNHRTRSWFSKIQVGCHTEWLGTFPLPEQAAEAYREAAERHHGEFAFHKRDTLQEAK